MIIVFAQLTQAAGFSPGQNSVSKDLRVWGLVRSQSCEPIPAATVKILCRGEVYTLRITDFDGKFSIGQEILEAVSTDIETGNVELLVTSMGFETATIPVREAILTEFLEIELTASAIEFDAIVITETSASPFAVTAKGKEVNILSRQGVFLSDPIETVRGSHITRSGSALSSLVRFSGSTPEYLLNGMAIGSDPAHFGTFSIVPSPMIERIGYTDLAVLTSSASPTEVRLETKRTFGDRSSSELSISSMDATINGRSSSQRYFVAASFRKSVLNEFGQLMKTVDRRRTNPSPDFEDVFLSIGARLNASTNLYFDQYHARDSLDFDETHFTSLDNLRASQGTRKSFYSMQLSRQTESAGAKISLSAQQIRSFYKANWGQDGQPEKLNLMLGESGWRYRATSKYDFMLGTSKLSIGLSGVLHDYSDISLTQRNWNFLPPYATTHNPNPYQIALNYLYGDMDLNHQGSEIATFVQFAQTWRNWNITGGVRNQLNDYLKNHGDRVFRVALTRNVGRFDALTISAGTYAETPVGNILQPFQILVQNNLSELRSIKTRMIKLSYDYKRREIGHLTATLFVKRVSDLPILNPSFEDLEVNGLDLRFLTDLKMESIGVQVFTGISISASQKQVFSRVFGNRVNLRERYSYTTTRAKIQDVPSSYSEEVPHQLELDVGYDAGRGWEFGALLTARSGFRYTAPINFDNLTFDDLYDTYSGENQLLLITSENSEQFSAHINLSLSFSYTHGRKGVFGSVSNVLNRSNPIISSFDGYILDNGILPNIGIEMRF